LHALKCEALTNSFRGRKVVDNVGLSIHQGEIIDHAYVISGGKILIEGDSDVIVSDPMTRELFLGESFSFHRT